MSIVFINNPLETFTPTCSGALATIIWECCKVARSEGLSPTVITRTSQAATFDWPHTVCIDYPQIPQNSLAIRALRMQRKLTGWDQLRHKAYAVRVEQAIRRIPDSGAPLLLINDPGMAIFLRHRFPNRPIVHWFQNQQEARPRLKRDYAAAASVTCGVSDFTSKWIAAYYGVKTVATMYNGVDADHFKPAATQPEGPPFVNFVGRTGIEKAPDLVLKAAITLSNSTTAFGVQLVGSNHWDRFEMDSYQRELKVLVDELKSRGVEVRQPGHVGRAALPEQFQRAQIHVVPSRWDEPFGLTTVEGMASGLATIASNTGGTPEVVGDAGMLFERDSAADLAEKLRVLVTDSDTRAELAKRARARAMEFSWKRTWGQIRLHAGV